MDPGHRDRIRRDYDAIAPVYAEYAEMVTPPLRERYLEKLVARLPADAEVLDLGCGPGVPVAAALADRGHRVTGIDLSPEMVRLARRKVPRATFIEADMTRVTFPPGRFDGAIALYSLIHVPPGELPALLGRIRVWLRPGGAFVATLGAEGGDALAADAGFEIEGAETITQQEPEGVVRFLWIVAVAA